MDEDAAWKSLGLIGDRTEPGGNRVRARAANVLITQRHAAFLFAAKPFRSSKCDELLQVRKATWDGVSLGPIETGTHRADPSSCVPVPAALLWEVNGDFSLRFIFPLRKVSPNRETPMGYPR